MDWIEWLFGISPDGGNGYFEWVIVLFVLFLVVAPFWRRLRRRLRRCRPAARRGRLSAALRRGQR